VNSIIFSFAEDNIFIKIIQSISFGIMYLILVNKHLFGFAVKKLRRKRHLL
jgi:hypothetical protein